MGEIVKFEGDDALHVREVEVDPTWGGASTIGGVGERVIAMFERTRRLVRGTYWDQSKNRNVEDAEERRLTVYVLARSKDGAVAAAADAERAAQNAKFAAEQERDAARKEAERDAEALAKVKADLEETERLRRVVEGLCKKAEERASSEAARANKLEALIARVRSEIGAGRMREIEAAAAEEKPATPYRG